MRNPIIFIPGTSGTSLDLDPNTPAKDYILADDAHVFPDQNTISHTSKQFNYHPASFDPGRCRIWLGPEAVNTILLDTLTNNRGNHYLDILKFDESGYQAQIPEVAVKVGTVLDVIDLVTTQSLPLLAGILNQPLSKPIYSDLLTFLQGIPDRYLYLFPYDWRGNLPDQVASLSAFIDDTLSSTHSQQVVLIAHSLGGLICRAYYLSSAANTAKIEKVITLGSDFGGTPLAIKGLVMGDTWGIGYNIGPVSIGLSEWETHDLAQNWGTSYFQAPNSDVWFFDQSQPTGIPFQSIDRSYICVDGLTIPNTFLDNMAWIEQHHNSGLAAQTINYFADFPVGDFQVPPPAFVEHHRIFSKGNTSTVVGIHLHDGPSDAGNYCIQTNTPVDPSAFALVTYCDPITGDGDGTISFHSHMAHSAQNDPHVYIYDSLFNHVSHFDLVNQTDVHTLIQAILDGSITNEPDAHANISNNFHAPTDPFFGETF